MTNSDPIRKEIVDHLKVVHSFLWQAIGPVAGYYSGMCIERLVVEQRPAEYTMCFRTERDYILATERAYNFARQGMCRIEKPDSLGIVVIVPAVGAWSPGVQIRFVSAEFTAPGEFGRTVWFDPETEELVIDIETARLSMEESYERVSS